MTKFLLHGGYTHRTEANEIKYYSEMLADFKTTCKVLHVLFARDPKEWQEKTASDTASLKKTRPDLQFESKTASSEDFEAQVEWADLLLVAGGETSDLLVELKKHPQFSKSLTKKVYAGSSAGAYAACQLHYRDNGNIEYGLGLLDLNLICHYVDERYQFIESINEICKGKYPTIPIKEEEFIVIYK